MPSSAPDARPSAACLLLVLLSVSSSIQAPAARKPTRISSSLQYRCSIGEKLRALCQGDTAYPESGILYWLANGTFVDQLYPNGEVEEEAAVEKGSQLARGLRFSRLRAQDFHTRFDCIITDPSGVFRKTAQIFQRPAGAAVELPKTRERSSRNTMAETRLRCAREN